MSFMKRLTTDVCKLYKDYGGPAYVLNVLYIVGGNGVAPKLSGGRRNMSYSEKLVLQCTISHCDMLAVIKVPRLAIQDKCSLVLFSETDQTN